MNVNCQTNDLIFSSSMLKTLYCKLVFYNVLRAVHNVDSSYYTLYSMHTTRTVSRCFHRHICQLLLLAAPPNQSSISRLPQQNSFISRCVVSNVCEYECLVARRGDSLIQHVCARWRYSIVIYQRLSGFDFFFYGRY